MATPSSPAHPPSPSSASPTDNSVTNPATLLPNDCEKDEGPELNGVIHNDEKKPDFTNRFDYLGDTDYNERFRKYKEDYTRRLMAKYFSGKTLYGAWPSDEGYAIELISVQLASPVSCDIFDDNVTIDGEIIKSSRWPCTRSYADPVRSCEEQTSSESISPADLPANTVNGQQQ